MINPKTPADLKLLTEIQQLEIDMMVKRENLIGRKKVIDILNKLQQSIENLIK